MDLFGPTAAKLAQGGGKILGLYQTMRTTSKARGAAHAAETIAAKERGLGANIWNKTKKVGRIADKVFKVGVAGAAAYNVGKAVNNGGLAEGGRVALNEALTTGAYFVPYAGQALFAADIARMVRNRSLDTPTFADEITEGLYKAAPSLRPHEYAETEAETGTEDDRPVEQPGVSSVFPTQTQPTESQYRNQQSQYAARQRAHQYGLDLIQEHMARNFRA